MHLRDRDETAFDEASRHWKESWPKIQTLESRDSDQAAKSSGVQPEQSGALSKLCGRPDRTACALSWLAVPRSGIGWLVRGARQSAASSSSRAPPKTKTRRRAERTGRRQPPRRWQPATGSQPRPDVQEGRPATAPTRAAEAQARGQRAEHDAPRPSGDPCSEPRPAARSRSTARVAPCVGARSDSDEPGEARTVTPPAARFLRTFRAARQRREVSRDLDTDGLSLVVLSSGVQEGRPFFISWHFGPNPPRAGELDAETRRGISATGDATR